MIRKHKNLLASLSKEAFNIFIWNLWQLENANDEIDYVKSKRVKNLGDSVIEKLRMHRDPSDGLTQYQSFSLVVPFFKPIDLLLSNSNLNLELSEENNILKRYHTLLVRRSNKWFWPQDGMFGGASVFFVSNNLGIEKAVYFDKIIPKIKEIVKPYSFFGEVGIGTYDSFLEKSPEKVEIVLKSLFTKLQTETSFYFDGDKIQVGRHIANSYLNSGVLNHSLTPCDTVVSLNLKRYNEIFEEFEFLINQNAKEDQLEKFVRQYFKQIFGDNYDRVETQIWLKSPELDINNGNRRVDIFLRNAVQRDWELVELKRNEKIITNYRDIPVLSSTVTGAISQLRNYQKILQQDKVKKQMEQKGIVYHQPQLRLVVGRNPDIPIDQWRRIKSENENGLKITTYDELLTDMKYRIDSLSSFIWKS